MAQKTSSSLIAELGQYLGMDGLCFGPTESCQLVFDQTQVVTMIHDKAKERITLNCPISSPDQYESMSRHTMRAMLQANFMGQGCADSTLSYGSDQRAYLQVVVPLRDSPSCELRGALELLLNQVDVWSKRLVQAGNANHDEDAEHVGGVRKFNAQRAVGMQRV